MFLVNKIYRLYEGFKVEEYVIDMYFKRSLDYENGN